MLLSKKHPSNPHCLSGTYPTIKRKENYMKTKTFGFSMLAAISVLTLSAVAFGTIASATDTPSPSPTPVVSTDVGVSDDVEILTLLSTQIDVTANIQVDADTTSAANTEEDAQEQAAFDDDIKAAVLSGDSPLRGIPPCLPDRTP